MLNFSVSVLYVLCPAQYALSYAKLLKHGQSADLIAIIYPYTSCRNSQHNSPKFFHILSIDCKVHIPSIDRKVHTNIFLNYLVIAFPT